MDINTPDLSHLTDDERKIIQAVIDRQKAEDKHDALRRQSYAGEQASIIGSDSLCQLCQKTKFVDQQSSRQCSICHRRFCLRCGIRLKNHSYLCHQCREKQEIYFSSKKNLSKQYVSDYILNQASVNTMTNPMNRLNNDELSSTDSISINDQPKQYIPEIRLNSRSTKVLRDFRYHSLEEKESGHEITLKDSGIDTASSSTILNVASVDPSKKAVNNWHFNQTRTEQTGSIYFNNPFYTNDFVRKTFDFDELCRNFGFQLQTIRNENGEQQTKIVDLIKQSPAETLGQLQIGDQLIEWNGENIEHCSSKELARIVSRTSIRSPQIQLVFKRRLNISQQLTKPISSRNENLLKLHSSFSVSVEQIDEKRPMQIQIAFHYDHENLQLMIYGAKNIRLHQVFLICQISVQSRDQSLSTKEKSTTPQLCLSNQCTWNESIGFERIDRIENIYLIVRLLHDNQQKSIVGRLEINPVPINSSAQWFTLGEEGQGTSCHHCPSSSSDNNSPAMVTSPRKRQLPTIPSGQLQINREKVSQDLLEKATQLKFRLHFQSTNNQKGWLTQKTFDQSSLMEKDSSTNRDHHVRQSLINLSTTSKPNPKEKPRLPIIRDKNATNYLGTRRGTTALTSNLTAKPVLRRDASLTTPDEIDSDGSELSSASVSVLSTHSERVRPVRKSSFQSSFFHRTNEVQLNDEELKQMAMRTHETSIPTRATNGNNLVQSTVVQEKVVQRDQRQDGTLSDSALSNPAESIKKRRPSMSSKALVILGLSKKANSASSIGLGKRRGFQRSEEIGVQPHLRNRSLQRQTSKENETPPTSAPAVNQSSPSPFALSHQREQSQSMPDNMKLWSGALKLPHERPFAEFIEGLGAGQVVGRQVLASPCHGEIQIGLRDQQGLLEVEIVRARNLLQKALYVTPPAPYVKVYLLDGKTCLEKQRTRASRRTLDPLIQQILIFKEHYRRKILQISVWGDYGKLDRRVFMGVCQINFEDLNLNGNQQNLDWYKLFSANSLMNTYTMIHTNSTNRTDTTNSQQS